MVSITFLILLLSFFYTGYVFHPQCLDFRPPFIPKSSLKFCSIYTEYGCCTTSKDEALRQDFDYTLQSVTETDKECEVFLNELLCLECHPYAAHLYDAEIPVVNITQFDKRRVVFPGLCKGYCMVQFEKCRRYILRIARYDDFYHFVKNSTKEIFCDWAQLSDLNYCYPDINQLNTDTNTTIVFKNNDTLTLCVEPVAETLANPLVGVHSNDGTHRLFIGEQRGLIYIIDHTGKKLTEPFLNITEKIVNSGSPWDERGLLGLAFHPQYKDNGCFYVYYSAPLKLQNYSSEDWWWEPHKSRVSEFNVDPKNPNKADKDSELIIMEIDQPEANHNGGMLMFNRDGYLYLFPGDGGGAGDEHGEYGNSLNMSTLLGKALRIDVNSPNKVYSIPRDNPFIGQNNIRPEIYAYGLRNAWRCSIDGGLSMEHGTGRIFCGDVGQNQHEEVDIIERGGNYGWRAFEGYSCYDHNLCRQYPNTKLPILSYNHSIGQSIVGGYVYRGCDNPNLFGKYFYADTMNGKLFVAEETKGQWSSKQVVMGDDTMCNNGLVGFYLKNILSFAESERGEVYILSSASPFPNYENGRLYRLVDPTLRGDPENCQYNQTKPKVHETINRRPIYYNTKAKSKDSTTMEEGKFNCRDLRLYICNKYFKPSDGKAALLNCESARSYVSKFCRSTCNLC